MLNRSKFFDAIKASLYGNKFTQGQVDGLNTILDACESANVEEKSLAYMLATVYHECNKTMQPIKEFGGRNYFLKMYDILGNARKAKELGNLTKGDGAKYFGRGYVQLTGKYNYEKAGLAICVNLVDNPDLALTAKNAADIMIFGMTKGWFTGKKLSDYFSDDTPDWKNARRIINGMDKAALIAGYAELFYAAIKASTE